MSFAKHHVSHLVVASMLALTACGGSDDDGTSTTTPTPTSTTTPTPTPTGTTTTTTDAATTNLVGTGVSQGTTTAAVVTAANAFLDTLGTNQKGESSTSGSTSTVRFALTRANAIQWTNLPGNRQGLRLNSTTLTAAQLTAAENLMATALSTAGKGEQDEIRRADDVLAARQGGYGSGLYSIAILGTPSATTPWMLQIAGHHLAYNIMYNSTYQSGSPAFLGVEPPNWVVSASGTVSVNGSVSASSTGSQHAPLETQRVAVSNLAQALQANSSYASGALLSGTYNDVVAGANGNTDSNFGNLAYPTTGRGLLYSSLDATTQGLVRSVIESYVNTMPSGISAPLLATYEGAGLASTYVGYSKGTGGTADFGAFPSGATSQRSYLRVDGPRIWIEFVVQSGLVIQGQVHYHSVWRDKVADYGGQFGSGSTSTF